MRFGQRDAGCWRRRCCRGARSSRRRARAGSPSRSPTAERMRAVGLVIDEQVDSSASSTPARSATSSVTSLSRATAARKVARPSMRTSLRSTCEAVISARPGASARSSIGPIAPRPPAVTTAAPAPSPNRPAVARVVVVDARGSSARRRSPARARRGRTRSARRRARAPRGSRCRRRRCRSPPPGRAPSRLGDQRCGVRGRSSSAVEVATRTRSTFGGLDSRALERVATGLARPARRGSRPRRATRRSRTPVRGDDPVGVDADPRAISSLRDDARRAARRRSRRCRPTVVGRRAARLALASRGGARADAQAPESPGARAVRPRPRRGSAGRGRPAPCPARRREAADARGSPGRRRHRSSAPGWSARRRAACAGRSRTVGR